MKDEKNQQNQQSSRNIDITTDKSGLHVENPPKGAEKMDSNYSGGTDQQEGNSSRYANTSDNEKSDRS